MSEIEDIHYQQVFDPRVQFDSEKDRLAAQIVWSTKSIELALEAFEQGLPLRSNPFLDNNPSLRKPNLVYQYTEEEIQEIVKCKMDILYFADTYGFLKTPTGYKKIKLRKYQRKILKALQENRFNILLACRQAGKTTTTSLFLAWMTIFHYDKTIALLGQKASTGYEILGKVKSVVASLPFFMKPGILGWNAGSYNFDSGSRAVTKATTIDSLQGFTIDVLFIDEFAYIKKNIENPFWENIYPTIEANPNSKIILASTPNGKNLFHKLWTSAVNKESTFNPIRVDWWEVPGRDEAWKIKTIKDIGSEDAFNQQYGLSFDTSVKSLLKATTVKYLRYTKKAFVQGLYEVGTDYDEYFSYSDVFKYNFKKDYFVLSVDVSEGLGSDYSVIKVYKMMKGGKHKVKLVSVAKFECNTIDIADFAYVILKFMQKFDQEKSRLIIERNQYGDQLMIHINNIIATNEDEELELEVETYAKFKRSADNPKLEKGLRLNRGNKRIGASGLKKLMDEKMIIETEERTIEQINNFGEDEKGNFKASTGNDDLVMPILNMAYYIISNNYGWQDLVEEFLETKTPSIDSNFEVIQKMIKTYESEDVFNKEDANFIPFEYDILKASGITVMTAENEKEINEYDFEDAELIEEETEYDFNFDKGITTSSISKTRKIKKEKSQNEYDEFDDDVDIYDDVKSEDSNDFYDML